jgi:MraZ protein
MAFLFVSFAYNGGRKCLKVGKSGKFMFIGEYQHNTDAKGRLIIPARFRDELGQNVILAKGLDGCITVYTYPQWNEVLAQLKLLPNTKRESRMYVHTLTAKAAECEFDAQGRVLIPNSLLKEADIEKECVVVGVVDHIEIWSKPRWTAYYDRASASFEEVAEQLTEFVK